MDTRWITFDLDGTLMQNPFGNWVFPEIGELISQNTNKKLDVRTVMIEEHNLRMKQNRLIEAYNWDEILCKILRDYQLDLEIRIEDLVKKHSVSPKIYLLEDHLLESLTRIKSKGIRLAIVTNGYRKYQQPVVEALKLSGLFDYFITPDQIGYAKPDERILSELLNQGTVLAHVGDRIDHDVYLANKLNICSVFISRKLPQEVLTLPPMQRMEHPLFIGFYQQKWMKETGQLFDHENQLGLPKVVIQSIEELSFLF
ncbi:HAD family hydrolase [Neobacillus dielmonensis]|uniref:HAD family hydrolase n=1 Tax=Neobacillus dielmonensis TaxID=1347369 RepID=UPI0005A767D0|nr:HAD family hydrolase [Neobacillus dielmonensis]